MNKNAYLLLFVLTMAFLLLWAFSSREEYQLEQVEIVVKEGDTLWGIAEKYCPNQDPRKTIHEIQELNDLEGHIRPYQALTVPREAEQASRGKTMTVEATAYTHTGNNTASGTYPKEKQTIATDPKLIPLGTKVEIDGHTYIAEDTGSAIKSEIIDIFMDSYEDCINWGRQEIEIIILD